MKLWPSCPREVVYPGDVRFPCRRRLWHRGPCDFGGAWEADPLEHATPEDVERIIDRILSDEF